MAKKKLLNNKFVTAIIGGFIGWIIILLMPMSVYNIFFTPLFPILGSAAVTIVFIPLFAIIGFFWKPISKILGINKREKRRKSKCRRRRK